MSLAKEVISKLVKLQVQGWSQQPWWLKEVGKNILLTNLFFVKKHAMLSTQVKDKLDPYMKEYLEALGQSDYQAWDKSTDVHVSIYELAERLTKRLEGETDDKKQ